MKKSAPTTVRSAEIARSGRAGRQVVRGAFFLVASTGLLGAVLVAFRGFWDEAVTLVIVSAVCLWETWRRKEPSEVSLSRRLSHHPVEGAAEDEEP